MNTQQTNTALNYLKDLNNNDFIINELEFFNDNVEIKVIYDNENYTITLWLEEDYIYLYVDTYNKCEAVRRKPHEYLIHNLLVDTLELIKVISQ